MTIYTARVNSEGDPESIWTTGVTPDIAEGPDPSDSTKTIVHISGALVDTAAFIANHYYKSSTWHERESRPESYYNWKDEAWVLDSAALFQEIRNQRNSLLFMCDWTQAADSPLTDEKKAEWVTYRAELRAVPTDNSTVTKLAEVIWPDQPS
jgi:hypothetical protein